MSSLGFWSVFGEAAKTAAGFLLEIGMGLRVGIMVNLIMTWG